MTKEELKKAYYADRPIEPYSDDDNPNAWANIAHYAEETLEKVCKRITELEKENAELKEKVGKYQIGMFDEIEKRDRRITKAKEIIREFVEWANWQGSNCPSFKSIQNKAEQFLKDLEK